MRKTFIALLAFVCSFASGQIRINPSSQINWPQTSGSGAPTLPCTSANFGQPFTDRTNNVQYQCGSNGWFPSGSLTGAFKGTWSAGTTYSSGDIVSLNGGSFISLISNN